MSVASKRPDSMRRGACPSLPEPMQTGDGLLVRIALAAPLTPAQLGGLAKLAGECGNGTVEVTARGNVQLRGLTPESARRLAEGLGACGIAVREGLGVETGPLAGRDPAEALDPRPLAAEISRHAAPLVGSLAPKAVVIVDGGGALPLDTLAADIRLKATGEGRLALEAGGARLGTVAVGQAAQAALRLLALMAARGPASRMKTLLAAEGEAPIRAALDGLLAPGEVPPRRAAVEPVGLHPLADGEAALGIGLALGQTQAGALAALAESAQASGVRLVAPGFGRSLVLIGPTIRLTALTIRARALGFVSDPADPRRAVSACPGRPACASGRIETHSLANALAPLTRGRSLHVSGCAKGCARPGPAFLTIVGLDEGAALVLEGGPRDAHSGQVSEAELELSARRLLEMSGG